LRQCFYNAVGRFVQHHGAFFFGQCRKVGVAPFLCGQEAFEGKPLAGQPRVHQCRHESRSSGQAFHPYAQLRAFAHEHEAGVAYAGCAGVGYKGHVLAAGHAGGKGVRRLVLVELVVRAQFVAYAVVL
jgi:hypothetical protein